MQLMSNVKLNKRISVETTAGAEFGLDSALAVAKKHDLEWPGPKGMTKGAVASAFWLWLADRDEDQILEILNEYLPRLESLLRDSADDASRTRRPKKKGVDSGGRSKPAGGAVLETEPDCPDPATNPDRAPVRRV